MASRRPFITITITTILLHVLATTTFADESDFTSQCFKCRCMWSGGMKTADCRNVGISSIPQTLSPALRNIDFSNNPIYELRSNEFFNANLRDVHKLQLHNCSIEVVNARAFSNLGLVIELDLSVNRIVALDRDVFRDNVKLRILNLNENKIRVLQEGLFHNMTYLQRIYLAHNEIEEITPKTFDNLPALQHIDLSHNKLKHMAEDFTEGLTRLNSLSIEGNPWYCDCRLQTFKERMVNKFLITNPTLCEGPAYLRAKEWREPTVVFACAPRILHPSANTQMEIASANYTVVCKVKGEPSPDVEWYFNGRLVGRDPRHAANKYVISKRQDGQFTYNNLTILNVAYRDRGDYKCVAKNAGGDDESNITLVINPDCEGCGTVPSSGGMNTLPLLLGLVIAAVLLILIIVMILVCFCCKKTNNSRNYASKRHDLSQSSEYIGLDGRPELEKALITEVNPIVKPPRHQTVTSSVMTGATEVSDVNKTLLDGDSIFTGDDESRSYEFDPKLSTKSHSNYETDFRPDHPFPPDLLPTYPPRTIQVSPAGSSASTVADTSRLVPHHGPHSPLASPMYDTIGPYRTLPYSRSHSPFIAAPLAPPARTPRPGGYVTIPRRPRQSWSSEPPPLSDIGEPLYDNLGVRTSATGSSMQGINRAGEVVVVSTPKGARNFPLSPMAIDPIAEHDGVAATMPRVTPTQRALSPSWTPGLGSVPSPAPRTTPEDHPNRRDSTVSLPTPDGRIKKVPPAPPPKPNKRTTTRPLFEDEGEDGTEV